MRKRLQLRELSAAEQAGVVVTKPVVAQALVWYQPQSRDLPDEPFSLMQIPS